MSIGYIRFQLDSILALPTGALTREWDQPDALVEARIGALEKNALGKWFNRTAGPKMAQMVQMVRTLDGVSHPDASEPCVPNPPK
jgi:hypothetical protein